NLIADDLKQGTASRFKILVQPGVEGKNNEGVTWLTILDRLSFAESLQSKRDHLHQRRLTSSPSAGHTNRNLLSISPRQHTCACISHYAEIQVISRCLVVMPHG